MLSIPVVLSILLLFYNSSFAFPVGRTIGRKRNFDPLKLDFALVESQRRVDLNSGFYRHSVGPYSEVIMKIENQYSAYIATLALGTPEQEIKVALDTGSSDLWVPSPGTTTDYTTFDSNASRTATSLNETFSIVYGDRTGASGKWMSDNLQIGNVNIPNMQFGYGTNQNVGQGILGIGPKDSETSTWLDKPFTYDNFPYKLAALGYIPRASYSLYLDSSKSKTGTILFGAVDTAKFLGQLRMQKILKIPVDPFSPNVKSGFYIQLDSVGSGNYRYNSDPDDPSQPNPALLDSGTSLIYAPQRVVTGIGSLYGKYNRMVGGYVASCSSEGEPINFTFGNMTISIAYKEILYPLSKDSPVYGMDECLIGIIGSGSDIFTLGDVFLRLAYVVYDLEESKIGLAQARYSNESDIKFIDELH